MIFNAVTRQREKMLWEQQWHDHDRRNVEQVERIVVVEGRSKDSEEQVGHLWEVVSDDLRMQIEAVQLRAIKIAEQIEARRNRKRGR